MKQPLLVREYQSSDRAACLAVFDSNVGGSFLPSERPEFAAYLDALPGPYFVLEDDRGIIACGGYAASLESPDTADLCWGMVRRDLQGAGIGQLLVTARLQRLNQDPVFRHVFLKTSHETAAFYEHFGFVTQQVIENGIAEGLHRYDMRLTMNQPGVVNNSVLP